MLYSILKKYIWVVNLVLIIILSYVIALTINDKVGHKIFSRTANAITDTKNDSENLVSIKSKQPKRSYYNVILDKNIFGLDAGQFRGSSAETQDGSAPKTDLNVELLGTYINLNGRSIAVIKNLDSGKINGYSDDEVIDIIENETVKLLDVNNCNALIERKVAGTETIVCKKEIKLAKATTSTRKEVERKTVISTENLSKNSKEEGIKQLSEDKWLIERKMLDELLDDPATLINQARVVPQQDGLRFFGIRPSSVFFKIGLRNGDIVHKINDVELNDVQNALNVFGSLKDNSEFSIDFTRRGKKQSYAYSVN